MKARICIMLSLFAFAGYGQKVMSAESTPVNTVVAIQTHAQEARMMNSLNSWSHQPIGAELFYMETFEPIYFQATPSPAHDYVGIDFPPLQNIQFVRIVDVTGMVVGVYHQWSRLLYIGYLQPGLYYIQMVQRNYLSHTTSFYKR